jgi:hypothetical protein
LSSTIERMHIPLLIHPLFSYLEVQ